MWDGNRILHEYVSQNDSAELESDNLVTWVFNDGFVPSAKITSEGHYSIISDYLGTPVEAYDDEGNRIWSAEIDVYGRVKEFTGEKDFIPFRYQGQYEDVEIGLYYNRFRYYDPEQGNYTQIDPIGLAGGNPTLYGYVNNSLIWVDIFGLKKGGTYYQVRSKNIGGEVHHTPAHNSYKGLNSVPTRSAGLSIWMETADHRKTESWGRSQSAIDYRAIQREFIMRGDWTSAIKMELDDIMSKFGN